jgi:hypothetical protein
MEGRAPLPEANDFIKGLAETQRRREQIINDYTYDVNEVEERVDNKGRVKETKTRAFEVFFVNGQPVQRQVAENGVAFTAKQLADEDQEVGKRVREIKKKAGRKPAEDHQDLRLSDILARYDFRALAREEVDGRAAIVMEFAPRPGKRDLEADHVLRHLAGRIWVDEQEREVVRAEVHNTAGLKFGLGLLASISEVDVKLQFRKIADGAWMPSRLDTRAAGRILLLKGVRVKVTRTYGRYRRFEVESQEKVAPISTRSRQAPSPPFRSIHSGVAANQTTVAMVIQSFTSPSAIRSAKKSSGGTIVAARASQETTRAADLMPSAARG